MRHLVTPSWAAAWLVTLIVLAVPVASPAEAPAAPGMVDWQRKVVRCTGTGAPNLTAAQGNVAVARIGAERAAKLDALRNCMEAVKGVRIQGGETVGAALGARPELGARVEGLVKGFQAAGKPRYFSDGGVEVDVEVPLDGITDLVVPARADPGAPAGPAAGAEPASSGVGPAGGAGSAEYTGLLVDARGTGVLPALAPRIVDDQGRLVYGAALAGPEARKRGGLVAYARDVEGARSQLRDRLGDKPRTVKALRAMVTDLVLPAAEAEPLLPGPPQFLAEGRVVVVTD